LAFTTRAVAARKADLFRHRSADAVAEIDTVFFCDIFPSRLHDGWQRQQIAVALNVL